MSEQFDNLIADVLHGTASPNDERVLAVELADSKRAREQFLDQLDVQAFLIGEAKAGVYAEELSLPVEDPKIVSLGPRAVVGAAAAVVAFAFVIVGLTFWLSDDADHVADRPAELSERLFTSREFSSAPERISAARDRVRKLRTELPNKPNS